MQCKEQSTKQSQIAILVQPPTEMDEQTWYYSVQYHINQMVSDRIQSAHQVIQPERHDTQRAIGFVTSAVGEGRPPEVILEEFDPRGGR